MTLLNLLLAFATATASATPSAVAEPAPAAATSHRAHRDPTTGAHVVIPPGWHVRTEAPDGAKALFVTKQNIDAEGGFLTGFSLNRFDGFRARQGIAPSEYAAGFAALMAKRHAGARTATTTLRAGMTVHEVQFLDDSRLPVTKLQYLIVADDAGDTLQLAWFETPEATVATEWPHGERILHAFLEGLARSPNDRPEPAHGPAQDQETH